MSYFNRSYLFSDGDELTLEEDCYVRVAAATAVVLNGTVLNANNARGNDTNINLPTISGTFFKIGDIVAGETFVTTKCLTKGDKIKITGGAAEIALIGR